MRQYIGVTGFMTCEELEQVSNNFCYLDGDPFLMAGILISRKTFREQGNSWPSRYPTFWAIDKISTVVIEHVGQYIHYHTQSRDWDLVVELMAIVGAYPSIYGIQLNATWPDINSLKKFKELSKGKYELILQVGKEALIKADYRPDKIADLVSDYVRHTNTIDYVLLDASGGYGIEMNVEKTRSYLQAIYDKGLHEKIGIAMAGGLSDKNLDRISTLLEKFPNLSIDAEGKLRGKDDQLDVYKVMHYISSALELMRSAEQLSRTP